jgi:hypothetical protein
MVWDDDLDDSWLPVIWRGLDAEVAAWERRTGRDESDWDGSVDYE